MSWKPRHEAHAIERVRLMFEFSEPLTTKMLRTATSEVVSAASDLGFDTVQPAETSVAGIQIDLASGGRPQIAKGQMNGNVLKRHVDGSLIEEAGFRDGGFGYMTTTYGRWENLLERISAVILPSLARLSGLVDLRSVKLEYWDSFGYDGPQNEADATQLLTPFDAGIPEDVVKGTSQWHSHVGWFEQQDGYPILINRNFDVVDRAVDDGSVRVLGVYTMVELRQNEAGIEPAGLEDVLDGLHRRSLRLFGGSLSEEYRNAISLDLSEYQ